MKRVVSLSLLLLCLCSHAVSAQKALMDYSYCGYRQSEVPIPTVPNSILIQPTGGDQSAAIQQAIDYVSSLKPDKLSGLRGAVLLGEGTFMLSQPLRISASGVVLRGTSKQGTVLRKTGADRGSLIYIEGRADRRIYDTLHIENYVPSGAMTLPVSLPRTAKTPVQALIVRPSTKEWIQHLGCDTWGGGSRLGYWAWHPGEIDICWHRTLQPADDASSDNTQQTASLSAPITTALHPQWGGARVLLYEWPGLISDSGVENLTLESYYDTSRPCDEDHCWNGISLDCAADCWVRMVTFRHFAGSAVIVGHDAMRVTVEDCIALAPVSEVGGMRRRTFFTLGGQTLFQRCYSEQGINDFSAGQCAPGPNAFVQCETKESLGPSGSIGPWASG